jgi:hypothetical protein
LQEGLALLMPQRLSGSTDAARRAGTALAKRPAADNVTSAATRILTSFGWISNRNSSGGAAAPRHDAANDEPGSHEQSSAAKHHAHDAGTCGAERHPESRSVLVRCATIRHHAVDPDGGNHETSAPNIASSVMQKRRCAISRSMLERERPP